METLSLEEAKRGLRLLAEAGTERINWSGGEPFLKATMLGEMVRYAKRELRLCAFARGVRLMQETKSFGNAARQASSATDLKSPRNGSTSTASISTCSACRATLS